MQNLNCGYLSKLCADFWISLKKKKTEYADNFGVLFCNLNKIFCIKTMLFFTCECKVFIKRNFLFFSWLCSFFPHSSYTFLLFILMIRKGLEAKKECATVKCNLTAVSGHTSIYVPILPNLLASFFLINFFDSVTLPSSATATEAPKKYHWSIFLCWKKKEIFFFLSLLHYFFISL